MALTPVQQCRIEVQDTSVEFPLLSDEEYEYFLEKNNDSVRLASLDAARALLMKLSINAGTQTVDIFSISTVRAAEQYRESLKLFLKNPDLNPMLNTAVPYAGGISLTDMQNNNANSDNVTAPVVNPVKPNSTSFF